MKKSFDELKENSKQLERNELLQVQGGLLGVCEIAAAAAIAAYEAGKQIGENIADAISD